MASSCRTGSKRGFVALIDAVIALFVLVSFTVMINSTLRQSLLSPSVGLQRQGMDVLTVLEYTNSFNSPGAVFAETSDSVCMHLDLYNGTSEVLDSTYAKAGCPAFGQSETVIWRTFVTGQQPKSARLAIWLKSQ